MHERHPKILGLSLLALVGVMAVSASGAQAKWLLLTSKVSVLKQTFNVTVNEVEFLAPTLGIQIFCSKGTGTDSTELNGSHTNQTGATKVSLTGCKELKYSSCKVMSEGQPNGTIDVASSGSASMEGEKVLITSESSKFSKVEFLGEECPFTEIESTVSGSYTVELENPLTDAALHGIIVVKQNLKCGSVSIEMHNAVKGPAMGSLSTLAGETTALHLVGL